MSRSEKRPTRSVSTRKSQTSVPTSAATWLCTTEPIATPISSQSTTPSTFVAARSTTSPSASWSSPPSIEVQIEATTSTTRIASTAKRIATSTPAIALPASTRSRPGVASSVGVIVPCRNSVVTIVIPRMIASSDEIPIRSTSANWKSRPLRSSSEREPTSAAAPIPTSATSTTR